ncbi:hypothetical protein BDV19DRAFT_394947 [Aspergillus venezuelensis]
MHRQQILLDADWQWRLVPSTTESVPAILRDDLVFWQPDLHSPSEIHLKLRSRNLIPDYKVSQNERKIQWASKVDWKYRCVFTTPKSALVANYVELLFEGLDTFATVVLNGEEIAKSGNMFIPLRVDLARNLCPPGHLNEMVILFESAERKGVELEKAWGERTSMMRDKKRMNMRKAQGWDWGPRLLNVGPYLPVYLDVRDNRIDNVSGVSTLIDDLSQANIEGSMSLAHPVNEQSQLAVEILLGSSLVFKFRLDATPARKTQSSSAINGEYVIAQRSRRTYRRALLQVRGSQGRTHPATTRKTFIFRVNNQPLSFQDADCIPADNLLPTISDQRYFDWVLKAHLANVNVIRVWGGGVYEAEAFWDACDELGMLVWQDYMFACGDYPIHSRFLESIKKEAKVQTIRIRNRASLALLCGSNEDFMFADWKCEYDYDHLVGPFKDTPFPHLWHGKQLPYQDYHKLSGRFVSEFGMHGYPDMRTVDVFAPDALDRHPQSQTIDRHNKGEGAEKRIARYMAENFRYTNDLNIYANVSQLMQSEAYGYALRDWRKFQGEGREYCSGAIIWQLNDCYPCTSWSFIDYYLRPKPAYYTIKRAFAPISVGIERTPRSRFIDEDHPRETEIPTFAIFAHNMNHHPVTLKLRTKALDMFTDKRGLKCKPGDSVTSTLITVNTCLTCVEYGQECTRERQPKKRGTKPRGPRADLLSESRSDRQREDDLRPQEQWRLSSVAGRQASALANRRMVTLLLDVYLDSIHPNFPLFCERELWVGWRDGTFPQDDSDFMSLMCLCALSAQHVGDGALFNDNDDVDTSEFKDLREAYIAEALRVVRLDFENPDLNLVRSYTILALLGAQTGDNPMLHKFLGLCHGVCAQLNLHDESRWPAALSTCEVEVQRRLWWSIYRLEVHTACVLGNIIRTPESRCGVGYPGGEHHPAFIPGRNGKYEDWFDGWNTTTDLYRVLEYAVSDLRGMNRPTQFQSILGKGPSADASIIMARLTEIQSRLLPQFVTPASRSEDSGQNRCGFQAPNIICTIHLARLLSCMAGDDYPLLACSVAGDLVTSIMEIPVEYIRATGSPLIQQLAGVGYILVSIARKHSLQEIHFFQIKHVLQSIIELLALLAGQSGIAGSIRERLSSMLLEVEELHAASPKTDTGDGTQPFDDAVGWLPDEALPEHSLDGQGLFLNELLTDFTWLYPIYP